MQEIIKVDFKEYGLQENKASEIEAMFKPMLEKMVELESDYNKVVSLEINKETCKLASELRKQYVKVRTGTAAIHKDLKAFYLAGGRFVDAWKNTQQFAAQDKEKQLSEIENYYAIQEQKRVQELQEQRQNEISVYGVEMLNLGTMTNEVWESFKTGCKINYETKIKAEQDAEIERLRIIEEQKAEQERIRLENLQLKAEQEKREKEIELERKEIARLQAIKDAELKAEQEKTRLLNEEIAKQKEIELQQQLALKAEQEAKEAAPDKQKLLFLANQLRTFEIPTTTTKKANEIIEVVKKQLSLISDYIEKNY